MYLLDPSHLAGWVSVDPLPRGHGSCSWKPSDDIQDLSTRASLCISALFIPIVTVSVLAPCPFPSSAKFSGKLT